MKLNNILPLISAVAVTFSSASSVHAADLKVGTIDMKAVFDGYYKTKEAEAKIKEARTQAKKDIDERLDIFNKAQE
jgi:hypothetical protein